MRFDQVDPAGAAWATGTRRAHSWFHLMSTVRTDTRSRVLVWQVLQLAGSCSSPGVFGYVDKAVEVC